MDWQVGDLAVCVDDRPCHCGATDPAIRIGAVYTVVRVMPPVAHQVGLLFEEADPVGHPAFGADRFRKIRPDEHEACEEEFVTLIKRLKQPAPAEVRHG